MPKTQTADIMTHYKMIVSNPIVFLHGYTRDHTIWNNQMAYFKNDHPLLAYDLREHGKSTTVCLNGNHAPRTVNTLADDLKHLLGRLGMVDPYIVGHSLGGMVAQAYAAKYDVKGLALVSTLAPSPDYNNHKAVVHRVLKQYFSQMHPWQLNHMLEVIASFDTNITDVVAPTLVVVGEDDSKLFKDNAKDLE